VTVRPRGFAGKTCAIRAELAIQYGSTSAQSIVVSRISTMVRSSFQFAGVLMLLCSIAGCGPVQQHARQTSQKIKDTANNVKQNLRKIQMHGEVDLEVMSQLTAVHQAYQAHLDKKSAPPKDWTDLESVASQPGVVQEAKRQGAFIRFETTGDQIADESRQADILFAITSANDGSRWAMQFGGNVVSITDAEYAALPKNQ
jgi:hypothetical protein